MDATASPLVLTKLRVPVLRTRIISRTRILSLLASEKEASFILVCAPAGYGKTSLLAEWGRSLLESGVAVAWYALDQDDDDPTSFGSYLVASLIQALGPFPDLVHVAQLLRSSPEIDLQRILPTIVNAIVSSNRECVLILDDYHLVGSPPIHSAIAYLLEHPPENLRVAIGSRSDPPLPLARLRARGQLLEIRTASLRFQVGEAMQFLNEVMGLELSAQGVTILEERTEGWATGLQLAALSMLSRANKEEFIASFSGSHRYLVEYLMEEVVIHQPEEMQSYLLATSILERLHGDLCTTVVQAIQAEHGPDTEILGQLEQANLFVISLDDHGEWFRYHHLFRDFLQTRLRKTQPERLPMLHRAACEWLASHHYLREAAGHAFQAQDWEYAATFVEQYSFTLIVHSEISTIYEWCSALPEEVMQSHPMLCLLQALALAYSFRRQNRGRVEARLQQANRTIALMEDKLAARGFIDMAGVVQTFLEMSPDPAQNPEGLLPLAEGMLGNYAEGEAAQFSGLLLRGYAYLGLQDVKAATNAFETGRKIALRESLYFGIVESTFHLARLAHSQGKFDLAADLCREAQAEIAALLPRPEKDLPAIGCLEVELGCIDLEQSRLEEAEKHLLGGLNLMGWSMYPYCLMVACVALFKLYGILGRAEEGERYLDMLDTAWPDIRFCTQGLKIQLALQVAADDPGIKAERTAWLEEISPILSDNTFAPGMGPLGAAEGYYMASLAWAQVQLTCGDQEVAQNYLERQLKLAEEHGLKTRENELQAIIALTRGESSEWLQPSLVKRQEGLIEPLSERELDVLRLMALGASNQEIAGRLVITVGTVKSHINHILGKLEAHNRTEAVARARGLELIDL